MGGNMTIWEFFVKGGPLMWPLLACSVIATAIILERLYSLRKKKLLPGELIEEVERLTRMGRLNDIEHLLNTSSSPISPVLMAAVKNAGMHRDIIREYMEEAGAAAAYGIERPIDLLGIIATISPLLGFLGTVSGMLSTFQSMSAANSAHAFPAGLSEALITTVTGLAVGIPVYICYRLFMTRSEYLILEMEKISARFLKYLKGDVYEIQEKEKE
jgi:biopolymer transport protein ExbB